MFVPIVDEDATPTPYDVCLLRHSLGACPWTRSRPQPGASRWGRFVAVTDVRTSRLELHAIDVAEAERIVARRAGPSDAWADDFPFEGDVGAVGSFLRATAELGE